MFSISTSWNWLRPIVNIILVLLITSSSVWLSRTIALSLVVAKKEQDIATTKFKQFALLYVLISVMSFALMVVGFVLISSILLFFYDRYYKVGFVNLLKNNMTFIIEGYSSNKMALLGVVIYTSIILLVTMLIFVEQSNRFLTSYYKNIQIVQQNIIEQDDDQDNELIGDDLLERQDIIDRDNGVSFMYKLVENMSIIHMFIAISVTLFIFATTSR